MSDKIRILQVKAVPEKGRLQANYDSLMDILRPVQAGSVDVVVTPECFLDGYVCTEDWVTRENLVEYAIDPSASRFAWGVAQWARDAAAWFVFGCTRRSAEGVYNTALIFDRRGELCGAYDKVHCQAHDEKFAAGKSLPVFAADFGLFGVMICADRRWPETVRTLALRGARVVFNPTYGMHDELNRRMMQTRSYESEVFIAFTHPRQALLTGPRGDIVGDEEGAEAVFAVNEIALAEVDRVRAGQSHLRDRRPEVYAG